MADGAPAPDPTHLRPSRRVHLALSREEAVESVREILRTTASAECWQGKGRWCEIHLPEDEQRVWTPYLSIRADHEAEGSSLFARFAPRSEVWTLFVFLYSAIAFFVLFGAIFGYVQWASGEPAWGLWAVWLGVPALLGMHLASYVGQRLARAQTEELQRRFDAVLARLPVEREE
jgi:hypothetical protein